MPVRAQIDFSTLPARIVPVVLVEGLPFVLLPAGVVATSVAVEGGTTLDPLFWPGTGTLTESLPDGSTFDPTRPWLSVSTPWQVSTKASPKEGTVRVDTLVVELGDVDGEVTAELDVREGREARVLAADLSATALSVTLNRGGLTAPSGIACIGRETVHYSGVTGNTLTLPTSGRGRYGSRAREHLASPVRPPVVTFGGAARWEGRLLTLWACEVDGTTLRNPTLLYAGTVGAGIELLASGTRWSVPVDHITDTMSRPFKAREVRVYGINHHDRYAPALFAMHPGGDVELLASGTYDDGGWHPTWSAFASSFNEQARFLGLGVFVTGGSIRFTGLTSGQTVAYIAAWDTGGGQSAVVDGPTRTFLFDERVPDTVAYLGGTITLPAAGDLDQIPSTLSWSYAGGRGRARLLIKAKTMIGAEVSVPILDRDGAAKTIRTGFEGGVALSLTSGLIVQRTTARVGILAEGDTPVAALRVAAEAIAALDGVGSVEQLVDWDDLERRFAVFAVPGLPSARRYEFWGEDSLLSVLEAEARLLACIVTSRRGRITMVPLATFAATEETRYAVTPDDYVAVRGERLPGSYSRGQSPPATAVKYHHREGSYTYRDATFTSELGSGDTIDCAAPKWLPLDVSLETFVQVIGQRASQLLGPLAEPTGLVKRTLSAPFLDAQPGDLVALTDPQVPDGSGGRGVVDRVCQIEEVAPSVWGGEARVGVTLRLSSADLAGYAPSALVAQGGISGAVLTLDDASAFGPSCFALAVDPNGNARSKPSDGFKVGDKVRLRELDTRTPMPDENFIVVAVTDLTVTLDTPPSAGMIAAAASGQYRVMLKYRPWGDINDDQRAYVFVADAATEVLGASDPPKRYAS